MYPAMLQTLFAAGEQKYGTDEEQFISILGNRSAAHLRRGPYTHTIASDSTPITHNVSKLPVNQYTMNQ